MTSTFGNDHNDVVCCQDFRNKFHFPDYLPVLQQIRDEKNCLIVIVATFLFMIYLLRLYQRIVSNMYVSHLDNYMFYLKM
jgi:hypothetical protein